MWVICGLLSMSIEYEPLVGHLVASSGTLDASSGSLGPIIVGNLGPLSESLSDSLKDGPMTH